MKSISLVLLLVFGISVYGQQRVQPTKYSADFTGSILIQRDTVICENSPKSWGKVQEISGSKMSKTSFEKEHNIIWYKLSPSANCQMSFTLSPIKISDDYDFIVYVLDRKIKQPTFKDLKPIRSNLSRNNKALQSKTGLGTDSLLNPFVGQGPGPAYSRFISLDTSKIYFIAVDNVYPKGEGHHLYFSYTHCPQIPEKPKHILQLTIHDKESGQRVNGNVLLVARKSYSEKDTLIKREGFLFLKDLEPDLYYQLKIQAHGYMSFRDEFKVYPKDTLIKKEIQLQSIEIGKKITIENIYFIGGTDQIIRRSYKALKELLFVLKDNPKLEVTIVGHVNQPYNSKKDKKESYYKELSELRAKAVMNYLIKRGIERERLSWEGRGYSEMLFPYARNLMEMEKNRRVEIIIKAF